MSADSSTTPPTLGVKVNYPGDPNAQPPIPAEDNIVFTGLAQCHYDNFKHAQASSLVVDITTAAGNNVTVTTVR